MPRVRYSFKPCAEEPVVVVVDHDYWSEEYVFKVENNEVIVQFTRRRTAPGGPPDGYSILQPELAIERICEAIANQATDPFKSSLLGALAIMLGAPINGEIEEEEEIAESV